MKKLKRLLIPAGIAAFIVLLGWSVANKNNVTASVPFTSGTDDISVDVCVNQLCDYIADGANDQREIKQAIDAVLAAGGGTVNIRSGDYDISSSIAVSLSGESLIIKGDGFNTILTNSMEDSSADGTGFVITGDGSSLDYLSIRDLYFVGSSSSGAGVSLIDIEKVDISNSKFYDFSASGSYGAAIKTSGLTTLTLSNNLFNSNTSNTLVAEASTVIYNDRADNDIFTIDLDVPADFSAAVISTSTGGITAGTYYFKLTALDNSGGQSLPTSETNCTTIEDGDAAVATSTMCNLSWTDVLNEESYRIWIATTSDIYYGYLAATTTTQFTFTATTSLVAATMPTSNSAYINKIATSSASWINSGDLEVEGFTQGNGILELATSTGTTILTEAQLLENSMIEFMVNTGATASLQLPATSTMTTLMATESKSREWLIYNATSSTMALTILKGSGVDLIGVTVDDDIIDQTEYSILKCWRKSNTDVVCAITEWLHTD